MARALHRAPGRGARAGDPVARLSRRAPRGARPRAPLLALVAALAVGGCERAPTDLTAPFEPLDASSAAALEPRPSTLGLRLRVALDELEALADAALPAHRPEAGRRRLCRRALGVRVCGTARWRLALSRPGPLRLERAPGPGAPLAATLPLAVVGTAGVEGPVARALGLDAVDVDALADVRVGLDLEIGPDWCPRARADVTHRWVRAPTVTWKGGLELDVTDAVDAAIERELGGLGPRLDAAIDCERLRAELADAWRARAVALELPGIGAAWLNVVPTGFAFSGLVREADALGLAFALRATTALEERPVDARAMPLPALGEVAFAPGRTEIGLPARLGWSRLERVARDAVVGRELRADTAFGEVRLRPLTLALGGVRGPDGGAGAVGVSVGFEADLPGRWRPVRGRLHLAATPTVDPVARTLRLEHVRVSPVLDGALWSLLGPLVESRLVGALRERGRVDLAPWLGQLEARLVDQLADPSRTAGLAVRASDARLDVERIAAGPAGLSVEVRASAAIDVDVPGEALGAALAR